MQKEETKKTKWVRRLVALAAVIAAAVCLFLYLATSSQDYVNHKTLKINDVSINIEYAISPEDKSRGLCCRDNLPDYDGMLFIYDQPGMYGFWMKDTRIPLDMYWLDENKEIIHIQHGVQPQPGVGEDELVSYKSDSPAMYILETNAGFAKKHGIKVGDKAEFRIP